MSSSSNYQCKRCGLQYDESLLGRCPGCNTRKGEAGETAVASDAGVTRQSQSSQPQPAQTPHETPTFTAGDQVPGYFWTGSQWLPAVQPSLAVAYFIRSVVLIIFSNLVVVAGSVAVIAMGEDGLGFFFGAAILALILVIIAFTSYVDGNRRLSSYENQFRKSINGQGV